MKSIYKALIFSSVVYKGTNGEHFL